MRCTENHLWARRQTRPQNVGKSRLAGLLSAFFLAVVFGSMQVSDAFGQIVYQGSKTGQVIKSKTVATASNLMGASGHLYLAAISMRPKINVTEVNGLGLTWILVKTQCAGKNSTALEIWMAQGTPTGNGAVTATFADTVKSAVIVVSRYAGVASSNPIGNLISGNTKGLNGTCSGGVDANTYSFNLTTTANNAVVYGATAHKGRKHTPGVGYTERAEIQAPDPVNPSATAVEEQSVATAGNVTVNGTFTGTVDWAMVALEIKPLGAPPTQYTLNMSTVGSGGVALNPAGGVYAAGTEVTLTATPSVGFQFSGWSGDLTGSTNPATITMNSNKTVTATFTAVSAIVFNGSKTGSSANSTTVMTAANMTAVNGNLYLAAISMQPKVGVDSVSGFGLNWKLVKTQCAGNNTTGLEVWMAQGAPTTNGIVTAHLASAPTTAVIAVSRYSGVTTNDPIGNVIAGNANGLNGACTGGANSNSYSLNLTTTTANAVVVGAAAMKAQNHIPGAGYTERAEIKKTDPTKSSAVAMEDKSVATASTVAVNGSFSNAVDWAMVGLEIRPQGAPPIQYALNMNTVGSGSVALNPTGGVYNSGTEVTLTATPASGFQFSGWSGDLTGSTNPATITMNGNKTVTATFTPVYNLSVNTVGSGSVGLNPAGGVYTTGTEVTLTATPAVGYEFSGWSGDLTGSTNPATITMDGNKTVTATFTILQYSLTVNSLDSGIVVLNPPGGIYDAGTAVTLTAVPDSGYQFSGWSGDLTGSANPDTITMDGNKNITATFIVLPQYTLTLNTLGSGSVAFNPAGGVYDAGTVVTLTATADPGFQFTGWSGDLSGVANPDSITINGNKSVTAIFTQNIPSGQIVHLETQTGLADTSLTVSTTAHLIGAQGHLYLAAISTRPRTQVSSVSGLGLTWTLVKAQCSGQNRTGVEVWKAQGTPTSNGAVTATFASAPNNVVIAVSRYAGTNSSDPIGNVISGNTVGANGPCAGGVDTSFYAIPLTTTVNGAVAYGAVGMRARLHTAGAGYSERAEIASGTGGNAASIAIEDKTVAVASADTVKGSFNGDVDWAMVGLEIKPPFKLTVNTLGSGSVTLDPPDVTYSPGTVVTLTATPNAGFQFTGWSGDLSGVINPTTITMDDHKTVTATFTPTGSGSQIAHEETQTGKSTALTTVATSTGLTAVNDHLYLAAIATRPQKAVVSVTGLGLTWSLVESQCSGKGNTGIELWKAQGTPTSNTVVTATLASAPSNAVITVSRYSGVDALNPIGNTVSGNSNGLDGVCTGGAETSIYSINLSTTVNDAVAYGAVTMRSKTHTPGAGFTERADELSMPGTAGSAASAAVEDQTIATPTTVAVNGSFNGTADWAAVAVELIPASGAVASKRSVSAAAALPAAFALEQNYPNPFNPSTMISFALPSQGKVTVTIFNETGQLVRTLVDHQMQAGNYSLHWNGRNQAGKTVAAGVYLYRIIVRGADGNATFMQTRRMMFLK
ncbi:MAG: hypothetical protein ALAOOOJD_00804 [bacterium]|nr:hypothetical protein [bacterium]